MSTLQTLQGKRRRLVKYQIVWGWRCGRIFVWVCASHHISSKKKWNKSRYFIKRVYFRYTLTYMYMYNVLFSDPRSGVRRRNKSLRRYCQIAEYICAIIMVFETIIRCCLCCVLWWYRVDYVYWWKIWRSLG